jgi:hypothetical protein
MSLEILQDRSCRFKNKRVLFASPVMRKIFKATYKLAISNTKLRLFPFTHHFLDTTGITLFFLSIDTYMHPYTNFTAIRTNPELCNLLHSLFMIKLASTCHKLPLTMALETT